MIIVRAMVVWCQTKTIEMTSVMLNEVSLGFCYKFSPRKNSSHRNQIPAPFQDVIAWQILGAGDPTPAWTPSPRHLASPDSRHRDSGAEEVTLANLSTKHILLSLSLVSKLLQGFSWKFATLDIHFLSQINCHIKTSKQQQAIKR